MSKIESMAEASAVILVGSDAMNISYRGDGGINGSQDMSTPGGNLSSLATFDVSTGLVCLLAALYGSISVLAVIGNGLVILVIVKNSRMQTVTNIFIANLAVADVIIGLFSIPFQFQAALLQRWVLAYFMCSLAPFVQVVSVNVSVLTLSVIAVDRYIAVLHPFQAGCSKRSAVIIITVTWAVAIGAAVPVQQYYWVEQNPGVGPLCTWHTPEGWERFPVFYNTLLVGVQYFLPLAVLTFCYCRIAWFIWGARRPGVHLEEEDARERNKQKVVKMMIIVVCLFVLCWLPLQLYNLLDKICPEINNYNYIHIIWLASNWLAMSNSCYNPFIYGLLNEKFKREFRGLFRLSSCLKKNGGHYNECCLDEVTQQRRVNNNGHIPPNIRQGAVRYLNQSEGKNFFRLRRSEDVHTEMTLV